MTSQAADDDAGSLVITVPEDLAECLSATMWMPWGIAKCSPYNFLSESSTWSYMTHLTSHVEYSR